MFFANIEGRKKVNEESKLKESRYPRYKIVLVDFQKINRLFMRFNRLFLLVINKNKLKQIKVRSGKEEITQTDLYLFTLTPRVTSSPQKPLGNFTMQSTTNYKPHIPKK